jgi:hypothetical protein
VSSQSIVPFRVPAEDKELVLQSPFVSFVYDWTCGAREGGKTKSEAIKLLFTPCAHEFSQWKAMFHALGFTYIGQRHPLHRFVNHSVLAVNGVVPDYHHHYVMSQFDRETHLAERLCLQGVGESRLSIFCNEEKLDYESHEQSHNNLRQFLTEFNQTEFSQPDRKLMVEFCQDNMQLAGCQAVMAADSSVFYGLMATIFLATLVLVVAWLVFVPQKLVPEPSHELVVR